MSEPEFSKPLGAWRYALAYFLFAGGAIILSCELLGYVQDRKPDRLASGLLGWFFGFLLLWTTRLRSGHAEPGASPDGRDR